MHRVAMAIVWPTLQSTSAQYGAWQLFGGSRVGYHFRLESQQVSQRASAQPGPPGIAHEHKMAR
jgi:hypothetical protein